MTAEDWRYLFDERVAICMVDGGATEAEARQIAWQQCVETWIRQRHGDGTEVNRARWQEAVGALRRTLQAA